MPQSDALARVEEVRTLARPSSGPLLAARNRVQNDAAIRLVFQQAKVEGVSADVLAERLQPLLEASVEGTADEIRETALYLADEYIQRGDAILLVSSETGRSFMQVTGEDIYVPEPVARESGAMAQPLPMLKPELQGMLFQHVFEAHREADLLAVLASRAHQTTLLRQDGDRRLLPATRAGRRQIEDEVRALLPTILRERVKGTSRDFLDHFLLVDEMPENLAQHTLIAQAHIVIPIADMRAMGIGHDRTTSMAAQIGVQWVRSIARSLSQLVFEVQKPAAIRGENLILADLPGSFTSASFWVAEPDTSRTLSPFRWLDGHLLVVPEAATLGLNLGAGVISLNPEAFFLEGVELFDRWEVDASFTYKMAPDLDNLYAINLVNVPQTGRAVEVLDRP